MDLQLEIQGFGYPALLCTCTTSSQSSQEVGWKTKAASAKAALLSRETFQLPQDFGSCGPPFLAFASPWDSLGIRVFENKRRKEKRGFPCSECITFFPCFLHQKTRGLLFICPLVPTSRLLGDTRRGEKSRIFTTDLFELEF